MVLVPKPVTVLLALLFVLTTSATPWPTTFKHTTHRTHYLGADRSLKLDTFHPESTFEGFGTEGVDPLSTHRRYPRETINLNSTITIDLRDSAAQFLAVKLGIPENNIHPRTTAQGQVAQFVFLVQKIDGIPVANAVGNVAFNNNGNVSSFSSSFIENSGAAATNPSVPLSDAIATAELALDGTYNGHPTALEFFVQPDGFAALTYVIQIQNETARTWYEAFVDAHENKLVSVTDFVAKASYLAVPIQQQDPTKGLQIIRDPQELGASPNGWHMEFSTPTNQTDGNNAVAYKGNQLINITEQSSPDLNFNYPLDLTQDPTIGANVPAAMTNAFYVANAFHDFAYIYGFTETTFNFQINNFDKGGEEWDRVLLCVQDDLDDNNVQTAIPPDGQSPKMELGLLLNFTPRRDTALMNDLLIHESQHGANHRMTGGGTARCYQTTEASAISEGYADAMADSLSQTQNTTDYVFGSFAGKGPTGLREHVYSTSEETNPLRYSSLEEMVSPYDMGEVWANTLHNVYASLVTAHGWSATALTDSTTFEGNVAFFHLLFDALLLQPCPPTFLTARDAFIQADANRYSGANKCLLWQTFASKGFGVNAANYVDDDTVPLGCASL